MKHLDLFSGIGGFALAADRVFGEVEHIFVEIDPFCQEILKKHWPNSKIYGDIKTLTYAGSEEQPRISDIKRQEIPETWKNNIDLLTGGFPCQPFSHAGKRKGKEDNRYLWPEMLRVIQLTKPTWIIAENVRGLLTQQRGMVFKEICFDLETSGYKIQPFIIPALSVNAPHRRDRVFIIGYADDHGQHGAKKRESNFEGINTQQERPEKFWKPKRTNNLRNDVANTPCPGIGGRNMPNQEWPTDSKKRSSTRRQSERCDWNRDWPEVATELCGMDDGLSAKLDGLKLTKSKHRNERLKALGNAIVPQVVIEILRGIKMTY
jgi:DNA (cytosine-5)-methyltransferase 1